MIDDCSEVWDGNGRPGPCSSHHICELDRNHDDRHRCRCGARHGQFTTQVETFTRICSLCPWTSAGHATPAFAQAELADHLAGVHEQPRPRVEPPRVLLGDVRPATRPSKKALRQARAQARGATPALQPGGLIPTTSQPVTLPVGTTVIHLPSTPEPDINPGDPITIIRPDGTLAQGTATSSTTGTIDPPPALVVTPPAGVTVPTLDRYLRTHNPGCGLLPDHLGDCEVFDDVTSDDPAPPTPTPATTTPPTPTVAHNGYEPTPCPICGKPCAGQVGISAHMRSHDTRRPCPNGCGRAVMPSGQTRHNATCPNLTPDQRAHHQPPATRHATAHRHWARTMPNDPIELTDDGDRLGLTLHLRITDTTRLPHPTDEDNWDEIVELVAVKLLDRIREVRLWLGSEPRSEGVLP